MIKAVIIDLDDTLCLTEAVCFDMENETLASMGRPPMSREVHVLTWGQPLFEVITERSPGINVEAFKIAYHPIIARYTTEGLLDTIPAENYEALDTLVNAKKQLLVLTSRTHTELKHLLTPDHQLASRIKTFYYRDNTQFHKPDPRAFDELLRQNKLKPEHCVYIGDSVSDSVAAKKAGLHFIASLESGLRQKQDFSPELVDRFIPTFPDVVDAVIKLDERTP